MNTYFSWAEAKRFYQIGLPIFIAQMSQTGMNFADTAMTGQYNAEAMAAVAVAGSIWAPIALLGIGCLMALPPLSAQMAGAGKPESCAHLLRQGIWLTVIISSMLMIFFWLISFYLENFGLDTRMADLAGSYLRALLWGVPGFMFFVNQRSFYEGFARTRPAMIIGLLGLALNVPCNYIMIYGKLGLPALGSTGCGIASAICYWFMGLAMMVYLKRDAKYTSLRPIFSPFHSRENNGKKEPVFDGKLIWRTLRIGFPSAVALFFEVSMFALSAILLAPMGTIMVAGNQTAMNFGQIVFMIPLAIGMTVTIRVGHCLGGHKLAQARIVGLTGMWISVFFAVAICALCITFRHAIVSIYTTDPQVLNLAMQLMFYLGAYQIVDGLQMVGISILRGYNDTRIISVICFITYWIVGLPLGYALALTNFMGPPLGAKGFWMSYLVVLSVGAICYWLRVRYLHSLPGTDIYARVSR